MATVGERWRNRNTGEVLRVVDVGTRANLTIVNVLSDGSRWCEDQLRQYWTIDTTGADADA